MAGDYGNLDGVLELPIEGRTLKISRRVTNRIKCKIEDWLQLEARRPVFRMKHDLSIEEYREALDSVSRISATELRWGGPVMDESFKNLVGVTKFITLLAQAAGEKVTESDILRYMQDPKDSTALVGGLQEILEGNRKANFLDPPDRLMAEMDQ